MSIEEISVVIPVHNGEDSLDTCISSVLAQGVPPARIVAVIDGCTDKSKTIAESHRVRVIESAQSRGHAAALNTGLDNVETEYVVFLDQDAVLGRNSLAEMVASLHRADVVQPQIQDDTGAWPTETTELRRLDSACIIGDTAIMKSIGGFDERYGVYVDDLEFAARLYTRGFTLRSQPSAVVRHESGWDLRTPFSSTRMKYATRNRLWYYWRYYDSYNSVLFSIRHICLYGRKAVKEGTVPEYAAGLVGAAAGWEYLITPDVCRELYRPWTRQNVLKTVSRRLRGAG